jgi:predicted ATPase
MLPLRTLELKPIPKRPPRFPFTVPFAQTPFQITFSSPVTFLVGENGSGKSTFLETLACVVGSPTVGSESVLTDATLAAARELAAYFRLSWSKRTKKGFFMRAEDFFGYARKMAQTRQEMEQDLAEVDEQYRGRSLLAHNLARMPYQREIGAMHRAYGDGLDHNSHGESFLKLFQERFVGQGLYLLDEPEAPLSPSRQLSLLVLIKTMVEQKGQFIIATHSPILMAYPGATILSFDAGQVQEVSYDTLEHVLITKTFLQNPDAYLRHLLA